MIQDKACGQTKAMGTEMRFIRQELRLIFELRIHATTQNNLGTVYSTLAEVEAKAENCRKAIRAYEEALKVFTREEFPEMYSLIDHNLRKALNFCRGE